MIVARLARLSALNDDLARLKAENARLRDENASLRSHLALAARVLADVRALGPRGRLAIVDGWNLVLGSEREAGSADELVSMARARLAERPDDIAWIVFDGPRANAVEEGRLRVSYTGGEGAQRTDRFVCDVVRAARLAGCADKIDVVTHDRRFAAEVRRIIDG